MSSQPPRPILVVDDDAKILRLVRTYLEREGFRVLEAPDGRTALASIAVDEPALVVLDMMLPEIDGMSVLRAVRRTSRTPVVVLSARGMTGDRIDGLAAGADDYVPKPFSPAELVLRVKRVLERSGAPGAGSIASVGIAPPTARRLLVAGDLVLDRERHEVRVGGRPVALTIAEFRLLAALLEAGGRVLSRDQLMDAVHGPDEVVLDRTIDVHVGRLRDKLGDQADEPRYIATVRGVGYRAVADNVSGGDGEAAGGSDRVGDGGGRGNGAADIPPSPTPGSARTSTSTAGRPSSR